MSIRSFREICERLPREVCERLQPRATQGHCMGAGKHENLDTSRCLENSNNY